MTDKELLELAAKAADIKLIGWVGKGCWSGEEDAEGFQTAPPYLARWNPLTDDGDALRLAVKLNINIEHLKQMNGNYAGVNCWPYCWPYGRGECGNSEENIDDPYSATRRAIVRAAAEIGKTL